MTTISTQQVLDYVLEQISKDFNIDHATLVEKYGSVETIHSTIEASKTTKKKVVRKVSKPVVEPVENPVETPVEAPKKKVVRKVSKNVVEAPKVETVAELAVVVAEAVAEEVAEVTTPPVESPKKKVVRKVTKNVVEVPKAETVAEVALAVAEVAAEAVAEAPKKKVVRKVTKTLDSESVVPTSDTVLEPVEEKVKPLPQPKRIVKKVTQIPLPKEVHEEPKKNSKKQLELVEYGTGEDNSLDGCDEFEENIYADTQIYNDEDSDSLEPLEINGAKYYVDSSNYVYHIDNQDLIGKLNEKGDAIIFLSSFSTEKND